MLQKRSSQILIVIILGFAAAILLINSETKAQEEYTGAKWEYREILFSEPVTFGSQVSNGFFINGQFREAANPETTVYSLFQGQGRQGWELTTQLNGQVFIFKRQTVE